jgi:hypothetical protein
MDVSPAMILPRIGQKDLVRVTAMAGSAKAADWQRFR